MGQQGFFDLRIEAPLDLLQGAFQDGQVTRLVAGLAQRIGLGRLDAQALQQQCRTQQLGGASDLLQQQVTLADLRASAELGKQRVDLPALRARGHGQHRRLVGRTLRLGITAQQAFQLAGGTLAVVLQALQL